jgi:uncharacterized membrane protein
VSEGRLRAAVAILALVGLGIAAYLTYVRYTHGSYACTTGGCELVQGSKYAELVGIPVAVIGLVGYAAILAVAFVRGEPGAVIGLMLSGFGFAFAVYLIYVQWALIDAFCMWCLISDVVMALILVLSVLRLLSVMRAGRGAAEAAG